MDVKQAATVHAASRVVVGTALVIAPKPASAGWIGDDAARDPVTVLARALGVRDAVMGLGVLRSLRDRDAGKPWLAACVAADIVDLGATVAVRDKLSTQAAVAVSAVAAGSAVVGAWLLSALD